MISLTINPPSEQATIIKCRPARVYVNGMRRRDLLVTEWEFLPAPIFARARLVVKGHMSPDGSTTVEDKNFLPPVGTKVLIRPAPRPAAIELPGIVSRQVIRVGPDQQYAAEVEHQLCRLLNANLSGRWHMESSSLVHVENADIRFNESDSLPASDEQVELNERTTRVFSSSPTGRLWSAADALAYLLAAAIPPYVHVPSLSELETLTEEMPLGTENLSGMSIVQAIMKVANSAGLDLRTSRTKLGLVFFRPGRGGQRRSVRLQPNGNQLDLKKTNLHRGKITFARRPSRQGLIAMGKPKLYESTFDLFPGWDSYSETSRWRDFVRSDSEDFSAVADVYRKWILNEHGRYSENPWSAPLFSFADISPSDFLTSQPRKFLPCISQDISGRSLGTVVEYRCGESKPWRRWEGPVWVSRDECTVYLGGDELPGDYFEAAAAHEVQVRVTAAIQADTRLTVAIKGDGGTAREVVKFPGVGEFRHVCESSVFHNIGADPAVEKDDTDVLHRLALRRAEAFASATEAKLSLGWINCSYHVGDIVERVDGRLLELASSLDKRPYVHSVRHEYGRIQSTTLTIRG